MISLQSSVSVENMKALGCGRITAFAAATNAFDAGLSVPAMTLADSRAMNR
jgi:hypothetical protein